MKTIEVEIVRMLGRLNALSRRGPTSPPAPETPEVPRGQGRGRMLGLLHDQGEMSQSQIASHLGIRPQSLSEMLAKAEADGVIVRRQSPEDKRQTLVSLTELGQSRVVMFRENHRKHAAEFLEPLTEEEKSTLAEILHKLIDAKQENE
jgi:DNA-binding MarR family transcriptional regulator